MRPIRNNGATVYYIYCRARDKLPTKTVAVLSHAQTENRSSSTLTLRSRERTRCGQPQPQPHSLQINITIIFKRIICTIILGRRVCECESPIAPPLIRGRECCDCRLNRNKQKQMRINTLADDMCMFECVLPGTWRLRRRVLFNWKLYECC